MEHQPTGNQPEPAKTRIYGSTPVAPLKTPSDTPADVSGTRVYGVRKNPTIRVKLQGGDRELLIPESDFDPDRHTPVSKDT